MNYNYKNYFGFSKEVFRQDLKIDEIYLRCGLEGIKERLIYSVNNGAVSLITGEIGAGKSTSLRYAINSLHPSKYTVISIIANTGSIIELLKQVSIELGVQVYSTSITRQMKSIKNILIELTGKNRIPVLIIDEAHLLRIEVFSQIHTLMQNELDSISLLPLVLCGQNTLEDKLSFYNAKALASRVIGKSHLTGLKLKEMEEYLHHHLKISGIKDNLFSEDAITAIHQGSGGLLRTANNLAKGALVAAASQNSKIVNAEFVRIAATELICT